MKNESIQNLLYAFAQMLVELIWPRLEAKLIEFLAVRPKKDWYSVEDVAEICGLRPRTIAEYCRTGKISFTETGRKKRISSESLDEFMERMTKQALGSRNVRKMAKLKTVK